jgi:hypothetical protein
VDGDNFDELSPSQLAPLFSAAAAQVERYEDTVVLPDFLCSEEEMAQEEAAHPPRWATLPPYIAAQQVS